MLRALSTAATGMEAQQTNIEVIANNLANVNTAGFKRVRAEFSDLLYQTLRPVGSPAAGNTPVIPTGQQVGLGTRLAATDRLHTLGDMKQTGAPLDLAIEGDGFFQVTTPSGEQAFTRAGAMKLDANGRIVTSDGYPLAQSIVIPPDSTNVTINPDGTVSVQQPGQTTMTEVGRIHLASFPNPGGLVALGRNLYRATPVAGAMVDGQPGTQGMGTVAQGTLEMSNVKVVEEMVDLIVGQRAYEINSKVIKAGDEMLGQTANLR